MAEDEYRNQYARFEFSDVAPGEDVVAILACQVRVSELAWDLSYCQGEVLDAFLNPETYVESNNEAIQSLADELAQGQANPCETLEALHHYVGEHITYHRYHTKPSGTVGALENRIGDCTEFADALLALSRAAGIAARSLEGVIYRSDRTSQLGQIKQIGWELIYRVMVRRPSILPGAAHQTRVKPISPA